MHTPTHLTRLPADALADTIHPQTDVRSGLTDIHATDRLPSMDPQQGTDP